MHTESDKHYLGKEKIFYCIFVLSSINAVCDKSLVRKVVNLEKSQASCFLWRVTTGRARERETERSAMASNAWKKNGVIDRSAERVGIYHVAKLVFLIKQPHSDNYHVLPINIACEPYNRNVGVGKSAVFHRRAAVS